MTRDTPPADASSFAVEGFRSHWILFVGVGVLFVLAGLVAMTVPVFTSIAHNEVLGMVLLLVGMVEIVQAGKMQGSTLFGLCLGLGCVAVVGGVFVYIEPFPDVRAKMAVMAIVFALHGLAQLVLAFKLRRLRGWTWLAFAGAASLVVAVLMEMKLPYGPSFTPATVGGVSILLTGWAYAVVALVARHR